MNTNNKMNKSPQETLPELYETDETAAAFFDWFNTRDKSSRETTVRVAAKRTNQEYSDIVDLFKKFKTLGLGSFLVGRRGAETRFVWDYDVKSLAKIATGEAEELESVAEDAPADDEGEDMLEHSFNLRSDLIVSLRLPSNFSAREADRLSGWIKSLPFD